MLQSVEYEMTKENLLEQLELSRIQVLEAIESLPDEALVEAESIGSRSVADLIALQSTWESELITGMLKLDQGKKPDRLLKAMRNSSTYARERILENRGRSLDDIFDDWQRVRIKLEEWIDSFSQKAIMDSKKFKHLQGQSLANIIEKLTVRQESSYAPHIKEYADRWLATNAPACAAEDGSE